MSINFPTKNTPSLPPNTIVPKDDNLFIPYFNRLYEDIAFAVNFKDNNFFPISITSTPTDITNLPNFGSFLLLVSGVSMASDGSWPPTGIWALCKSSNNVAGLGLTELTFQVGQGGGMWGGTRLSVTSTANNYQIAHNAAQAGNFNIRIVGTQG